jgi:hypothetical protein
MLRNIIYYFFFQKYFTIQYQKYLFYSLHIKDVLIKILFKYNEVTYTVSLQILQIFSIKDLVVMNGGNLCFIYSLSLYLTLLFLCLWPIIDCAL